MTIGDLADELVIVDYVRHAKGDEATKEAMNILDSVRSKEIEDLTLGEVRGISPLFCTQSQSYDRVDKIVSTVKDFINFGKLAP